MRKKPDTRSNKKKEDLKNAILTEDFFVCEFLTHRRLA